MTTGNFSLLVDISRDFLTLWLIHFYVVVESAALRGGMICSWGGTKKTANAAIYIRLSSNRAALRRSPLQQTGRQHNTESLLTPKMLSDLWPAREWTQRPCSAHLQVRHICAAQVDLTPICVILNLTWNHFFRSRLETGVRKAHQYYEVN